MAHKKTILTWLNDAHAMEESLIEVLENHIDQAAEYPEIEQRLKQHLEETKNHRQLVRSCIDRLGGDVSTVKSSLANMMGALQGIASGIPKDNLIKNALTDYSAEHFEIASYTSLAAAAEAIDDTETVNIAKQILKDEEAMAQWLIDQIPLLTTQLIEEQDDHNT